MQAHEGHSCILYDFGGALMPDIKGAHFPQVQDLTKLTQYL
jgi:hypothetical protein